MLSRFVLGFALGGAEAAAPPIVPGCGEFDRTDGNSKCEGDAWVVIVTGMRQAINVSTNH